MQNGNYTDRPMPPGNEPLPGSGSGPDRSEQFHKILSQVKFLTKRYWWVCLVTLSIAMSYQAYSQYADDPLYVSRGKMMVSGRVNLPAKDAYKEEYMNFFGTQLELMTSPKVRSRARERVKTTQPDLEQAEVSVNAKRQEATSIFILTAKGSSPEYTHAFLDALMKEYLNFRKQMRSSASESTLMSLTEQVMRLEDEMKQIEDKKINFQRTNNLGFIRAQDTEAGSNLSKLNSELSDLQTQLQLLESLSLEENLKNQRVQGATNVLPTAKFWKGTEDYLEMRKELNRLKAEKEEFERYLKPKHPKMIQFNRDIERAEHRLEIYRKQARQQLDETKQELRNRIKNLQKIIEKWEEKALENRSKLAEYERLNAEHKRKEELYNKLLGSMQSIDLNLNVDQETVSILEDASPPREIREDFGKQMTQSAAFGLMLGAGLIYLVSLIDVRVITSNDLKQSFNLPVLGMIPLEKVPRDRDLPLLTHNDQRFVFAESFRTLRSSLIFLDMEMPSCLVIGITSSIPREGKTTVAGNLAVTLASASSPTLLVDGDLRRGQLHDRLGVNREPGLTDLLRSRRAAGDVIRKTEYTNLDFMATGELPDNPAELLLSPALDRFIQEMRLQYDYVLFDLPPILAADDTNTVAKKLDGSLYTVRSGITQVRQVKPALDRLAFSRANLLGFVLNSLDSRQQDYYYKYYGYYYQKTSG